MYHYAGNNPVRFVDPDGRFNWDTNTIESGDTLYKIANECNRKYGTNYTADDLQSLNSDTINDKNKIYAGKHLNLGKAEAVQKMAADYIDRSKTPNSQYILPKKNKLHGDFFITAEVDLVAGYVVRELEGDMPVGFDGNLGFLPASIALMTDDKGFAGGSVTFGPGVGLSSSTQKSTTLSINKIISFMKRK